VVSAKFAQVEALGERSKGRLWPIDGIVAIAVASAEVGLAFAQAAHRGYAVGPGEILLLAAQGLVLAGRRRFPAGVMVATYGLALSFQAAVQFGDRGGPAWLAVVVAFVTAVYLRRRLAALVFLVACYAVSLWGPVVLGEGRAPSAVFAVSLGAGLGVLLGGSELVRLRRQRSLALAQGRREEARREASEERLRIARDLHDIVAHNISVINVQANSALHLMDRQPERAREALSTIHDVSKQALVELRSVLGVLRDLEGEAPRAPAPGLTDLGALLERTRAGGLTVQVLEEGEPHRLPSDVQLTAYRIVQESLTNSTRHSGGDRATVRLSYGDNDLLVEVTDDGPGLRASRSSSTGKGITGMTERAEAIGGELKAGPRPGGGFSVQARLPINGGPR